MVQRRVSLSRNWQTVPKCSSLLWRRMISPGSSPRLVKRFLAARTPMPKNFASR
jgi:hypothetical protein